MKLESKLASQLTEKDRQQAQKAAFEIINKPDIEAWKCLLANSDFLFDFIKEKIAQNLLNVVNSQNIANLLAFLKYHSSDWDDFMAVALKTHGNAEIEKKIFSLMKLGTDEEKAYCAKYFEHKPNIEVAELLFFNAKSSYEPLTFNCARALGVLQDKTSYDFFIENLENGDEWQKYEAAKFLSAYGNKEALIPILKAMQTSSMNEHLAGEASSLCDIYELFDNRDKEVCELSLECFDNILSGLVEIWPLSVIFNFKVYEAIQNLLYLVHQNSEEFKGKYALLLLKSKQKFELFIENDEYRYDEDKNTIAEMDEILAVLNEENEEFWNKQKENVLFELKSTNINRKISALKFINETEFKNAKASIKEMLEQEDTNEILICEALSAISKITNKEELEYLKAKSLPKISGENIKALVESLLAQG